MTSLDISAIANATKREVENAFDALEAVHTSDAFQKLLEKLWELQPGVERQVFIRDIVHNQAQLEDYGLTKGSKVALQRTYFDDDRPTLMALVFHLPEGLGFRKVTITYDDITRYKGDGGDLMANPFTASILRYRTSMEDMAGSEHVIRTVLALPEDPDEKLIAIRHLSPDSLAGMHIPELRVAARWFEHDTSMLDPTATRYQVPSKYDDGPPKNPRPPVKPPRPGGGATTCVSLGWYLCASQGN